ncbi:topoisomerase DNA-binding C4 zinc finger domain-containing protein [Candidatus Halobonum tyrrellensis]|uniref:DNA topoisomerase type IA zn finger domain-containing protein n=1 Tax=Candidatus Halobonum tyrrellensis G22 TaxID=1324957 RepID=V4HJ63_9EURY|nr:topoisomerase DNA-binding C4 zinc finger domain-containing protein [Candidatus Halobonum tyrrellensis]ESP87964.1 DNA topoisomerase type IA zn finger domain-containing protein [Candidatus Halobonum tyrrellensis G22]
MPQTLRVFAGDCTTEFDAPNGERTQRGRVLALAKPDRTVLVHDADGYQPVAWLTRPESLTVESDDDGFALTARDGDRLLRVRSNGPGRRAAFAVTDAGVPVGDCPDCGAALVRAGGDVVCPGCDERYGLPAGATVYDDRTCNDCGLPLMRVARGESFDLCVDYACESLADAVREALDRRFDCPDCGRDLCVREHRGRTFLGCDGYPDCETAFSVPAGELVGTCACGLPLFETGTGVRCLDGTCERASATNAGP